MTDPITDMLNRIRNAQAVAHTTVKIPFSDLKYKIAKILEQQKYVAEVQKKGRKIKKVLEIALKYDEDSEPAIAGLKRISKPGQRIYTPFNKIRRVKEGHGIAIISTPKGLMTGQQARKQGLGGELLCEIW